MWRLFPSPFAAHTRTCWATDEGDRKRSSEVKEVSSYDNSQRLTHRYGETPSNEAFEGRPDLCRSIFPPFRGMIWSKHAFLVFQMWI